MSRISLFLPLGVFLALVGLLYAGFSLEDPHRLPSAMVGRAFPAFELPRLDDEQRVATQADLKGRVALVNVWATWCPTCKAEHAELMRIHEETGLPIIGINYKDDPAAARRWLTRYGDPYEFSIIDRDGRLGVELGVYGAPETFVLDRDGVIVHKRVGDVNRRIWDSEIAPLVQELDLEASQGGS
jgi:cytochrome c biogenesis protein CcmG, thiol:disulfide interchange protein DsbE